MSLVLLTTCDNSIDANLIKTRLESEGIPCFIHNENTTNLLPHIFNLLGSGARVLVPEDRLMEARALLEINEDVLRCPNCKSTDIKNRISEGKKYMWLIAMVILFVLPIGNLINRWRCNNCGTEFKARS